MVYSRIIYGIVVYGACRQTLLKKVQILQNKLLKVLHKLPYRFDTNKLHSGLDLLKVKDIYDYQISKFVHASIYETCISQFHGYYTKVDNIHQIGTRQQGDLYISRPNNKFGEASLKYCGSLLWNSLDCDLQRTRDPDVFKKDLRKLHIDRYKNDL